MTKDYQKTIASFSPQFGNANHIAAMVVIERVSKLQEKLDATKPGAKPLAKLLSELKAKQNQVLVLIDPQTPLSTYPPSFPQNPNEQLNSSGEGNAALL